MKPIDPAFAEQLASAFEQFTAYLRHSAGTSTNDLALLDDGEQLNGERAASPKRAKKMTPTTTSMLMKAKDAAALLQVDARTLRRMWRAAEVPAPIRVGRAWRWRRRDLEKWIEEQVAR